MHSYNLPYEKVGENEPVCIADDVPFEIPDSWEWVRLNSGCLIYTGNSINEQEKKLKYTSTCDGWNYIGTKDINFDNAVCYNNGVKIPFDNNSFRIAFSGSVLLCIEGGSAGRKIALIDEDVCFGNKLCCFNSRTININFLFYFLQSPAFVKIFKDNKTGIIGCVSINKLKEMFMPLPPLSEQHRIVEKIEELLPYIEEYDKVEQKNTELDLTFPDKLKKSILQEAIQGKLVRQDSNDEPPSELIKRIRAEKERLIKEKKIKKDKNESYIYRRDNSHYEKVNGIERCIDDEIPFEIPDSWEWVRLGNICNINPRNIVDDDLDVGFIPMTLIQDGYYGGHSFEIKKWKNIKSGFTHFVNGDLVLAKITPCFQNRKSTIITNLPNNIGAGTTELHVLRNYSKSNLNLSYILLLVKSEKFISEGVKSYTGTAGQQRIGKNFLDKYLVPLPPILEQEKIVKKYNEVLQQIDKLKM